VRHPGVASGRADDPFERPGVPTLSARFTFLGTDGRPGNNVGGGSRRVGRQQDAQEHKRVQHARRPGPFICLAHDLSARAAYQAGGQDRPKDVSPTVSGNQLTKAEWTKSVSSIHGKIAAFFSLEIFVVTVYLTILDVRQA